VGGLSSFDFSAEVERVTKKVSWGGPKCEGAQEGYRKVLTKHRLLNSCEGKKGLSVQGGGGTRKVASTNPAPVPKIK